MILGIGTDIVQVSRLEKSLDKIGSRAFTACELDYAQKSTHCCEHLAGRWAAKEALAKALGCGFGERCSWLDIEVINTASGQPEIHLSGRTLQTFLLMGGQKIHLSISHEKEYATAFVIVEG